MFIEKFLESLLRKDKRSLRDIGIYIIVAQLFIFVLTNALPRNEIVYLSFLPILCFSFFFGELFGFYFALAVGFIFSPLGIEIGKNSYWWSLRAITFCISAIVVGWLATMLRNHLDIRDKLRLIDIFTGWHNRFALLEKFENLALAEVNGSFSIVVISLSNRTALSETFGNDVTRSIFHQFKERCEESIVKSWKIDAFSLNHYQAAFLLNAPEVIVAGDKTNFEQILLSAAKRNFLHNGFYVHGDIHIGVYYFSEFNEANKGNLPLKYAEEAVETATKQMKDVVVYSPSNDVKKGGNLNFTDILGDIDLAIRSRWMFLVYQPKIDMDTGKIHAVEALIRWNHPTKGFVPPDKFIPQAEQSTLIENITDFVVSQAVMQQKLWQRSGIYVNIAVNVSTYNLLQPNFVNKFLDLLKEKDLQSECLEIEVTEGALIADFQRVLEGLNNFHDAKIKIALDDFGTGYSSFQYLQQLPVDYIKIDQSFVRKLSVSKESREIVRAIVDLAHTINVKTIAEGVETIGDYDYLNSVHCDIGQGFYMSKPLTSNNFTNWYSENNGIFEKY
ncbi:hypothetical protein AGMMS49938_05460 [Fibrobacterales bacterium]|nr:hypothetical protein AGMMS49938_05460 [Fibrobacterales bacterium]